MTKKSGCKTHFYVRSPIFHSIYFTTEPLCQALLSSFSQSRDFIFEFRTHTPLFYLQKFPTQFRFGERNLTNLTMKILRTTKKLTLVALALASFTGAALAKKEPVDYVNPFVESTKSRYFFFNSACRPFGMIKLNPDTILRGCWQSGYRYQEPFVRV